MRQLRAMPPEKPRRAAIVNLTQNARVASFLSNYVSGEKKTVLEQMEYASSWNTKTSLTMSQYQSTNDFDQNKAYQAQEEAGNAFVSRVNSVSSSY